MRTKIKTDDDEIIALYNELGSVKKVALKTPYSDFLIRSRLKEHGVKLREKRDSLNEETVTEIIALHKKDKSAKEIAKELGISVTTVYKKLRDNEIKTERKQANIPVNELLKLRKKGYSLKDVGDIVGKSGEWVRVQLINAGESTDPKQKFDYEEMKKLRKEGESIGRIARKLGCSKGTVQKGLRKP